MNKASIKPKAYVRLSIGDIIKFGASTRMYILGCDGKTVPDEEEEENEKSGAIIKVTEKAFGDEKPSSTQSQEGHK